jgi:peptide/nickel transport system substrate-binding protein
LSDIVDPSELIAYAGAGDQGSFAVWTFYNNEEVNRLGAEGLTELDVNKRAQTYMKMQQLIHEDAPFLWLYWQPARSAVRNDVHNFTVLPTGNYWLEEVWKD